MLKNEISFAAGHFEPAMAQHLSGRLASFGVVNLGTETALESPRIILGSPFAHAIGGNRLNALTPTLALPRQLSLVAIQYNPSNLGLTEKLGLALDGNPYPIPTHPVGSTQTMWPGSIMDFLNNPKSGQDLSTETGSSSLGIGSSYAQGGGSSGSESAKNGRYMGGGSLSDIKVTPSISNLSLQPIPESHSLFPLLVPILATIYPLRAHLKIGLTRLYRRK
jgi:hypothetical protein